jgi:hypothetical protein
MLRMVVIQGIFGAIGGMQNIPQKIKYLMIVFCTICFMGYDFHKWSSSRNLNVYENIGLNRRATDFQIEETIKMYDTCMNYEPECNDK